VPVCHLSIHAARGGITTLDDWFCEGWRGENGEGFFDSDVSEPAEEWIEEWALDTGGAPRECHSEREARERFIPGFHERILRRHVSLWEAVERDRT
jgi:hypothetical protein